MPAKSSAVSSTRQISGRAALARGWEVLATDPQNALREVEEAGQLFARGAANDALQRFVVGRSVVGRRRHRAVGVPRRVRRARVLLVQPQGHPLLIITAITWLYFAICESSAWQGTIGKVDDETLRKSFELNFWAHQSVAQNAVGTPSHNAR